MRAATTLTAREAWALREPVRHTGAFRIEEYEETFYHLECRDHPGWGIRPERIVLRRAYWGSRATRIPERRRLAPELADRQGYLILAAHGHEHYQGPCPHIRIRFVSSSRGSRIPVAKWMPGREPCSCEWCNGVDWETSGLVTSLLVLDESSESFTWLDMPKSLRRRRPRSVG